MSKKIKVTIWWKRHEDNGWNVCAIYEEWEVATLEGLTLTEDDKFTEVEVEVPSDE